MDPGCTPGLILAGDVKYAAVPGLIRRVREASLKPFLKLEMKRARTEWCTSMRTRHSVASKYSSVDDNKDRMIELATLI